MILLVASVVWAGPQWSAPDLVGQALTLSRDEAALWAVAAASASPDLWRDVVHPGELATPPVVVVASMVVDSASVTVREALLVTHHGAGPLAELVVRLPIGALGAPVVPSIRVDGEPVQSETLHPDVFLVPLDPPVAPGRTVSVSLRYRAEIPKLQDMAPQNRRLRRTESDVSVAGALAQPTVWVEGVQERAPYIGTSDPGAFQAAIFVVDLSLPPDWVAFGAGSLVPGLADRHAWVGTREAAVVGMKAPTVLGQSAAGVSVHVVHRGHPKRAARVLAATVACLEDFSAWFGPLSHRTLDVVLLDLPQRGLGVELPGLILLDAAGPGEATEDFIVAHEVAHQWWYGEVGSDALGEPWVDEGLAMWASLAHIAPGRRKRLTQILTWFSAATASVPATSPASDIPFDAFGLVYLRGAMYLEERRATLGNDVFLSRLKALVRDQRWGFVTADDLRARMAGSDAAERWLEAPEPGEPDRWPSFRVD